MPTLLIYKNQANTIKPTLTEKVTIASPRFIFRLKSDQTNNYTYFTALNTSTETQRFDTFSVTEQASPNPLSGQVDLSPGGYLYEAYEITAAALAALPNLQSANYTTLTKVESGVLQCIETPTPNTEYAGASTTNTVYE